MDSLTLGVVGCGSISDIYFRAGNRFDSVEIIACSDLDTDRAEAQAAEYDVPMVASTADLLSAPEIEGIVNLTPPSAHADVGHQAIEAGKHLYNEKPVAPTVEAGFGLIEAANEAGVLVGGAPDTFLGTGLQTCRDLLETGRIGDPIGATAIWTSNGHENWHPNPEGFYHAGGGPLFDMGPYYLTALVHLLGPAETVSGATRRPFDQREITSDPKSGTMIDVEVPTHETGIVEFANGAAGTVMMSFDVWGSDIGGFEVYGTDGTLSVTNPNHFAGTPRIRVADPEASDWESVPVEREHPNQQRGFGLIDLARAIRTDWTHRSSGDLALHVLEIMDGLRRASDERAYTDLATEPTQPASIPDGFPEELLE